MTNAAAPDTLEQDIALLDRLRTALTATRAGMAASVVGQEQPINLMLIGLIAGGHVLLEGAPGVGKTLMVRSLANVTGLSFSRIQFTPDLMPADITGAMVLSPDEQGRNHLEFRKGPVFTQLLLADEINRATPRTQSALLEAMQEGTISAAGQSMPLPRPFFVLATQNPIEMEGTYALPEAQIDRFLFRIDVPYPDRDALTGILTATTGVSKAAAGQTITPAEVLQLQELSRGVPIAETLRRSVATFALMTQPGAPDVEASVTRNLRFGLSPRGAQSLVLAAKAHALLAGRNHVSAADLRAVLLPVIRHRLQLNFEGQASRVNVDELALRLFDKSVA